MRFQFKNSKLSQSSIRYMRKRNIQQLREVKYDQTTNYAIDLEGEVNRSIVFPKITAKIVDQQLKDYVNRKKMQEEEVITHLKGQVDKLKRHVYLLEDQRFINNRIRTQDFQLGQNSSLIRDNSCCGRGVYIRNKHMMSHHVDEPVQNLRNSQDCSNTRMQRNTDKQVVEYRGQNSHGNLKKSQVELQSMVMHRMGKGKQNVNSKHKIGRNSKVSINSGSSNKLLLQKTQKTLKNLAKKKKFKSNPQARRKLKACIIAVYFSIFLPSFSRKIYQNKLKSFMLAYPHEIGKYYDKNIHISKFKLDQKKIWQVFEENMNLMDEVEKGSLDNCLKDAADVKKVKVHFQFLINQEVNSSEKDEKEPLTYEQQLLFPKNVQFLLGKLVGMIDKFCESFSSILNSSDFVDKYWRTISQGLLTDSFVNNSRPKLLGRVIQSGVVRLQPHKQKLTVQNEETEIALLTFDVFCRIFCYRWMAKLHRDKINKKYTTQSTLIGNFLLTILYIIGEMIIDDKIKVCIKTSNVLGTRLRMKANNTYVRKIRPIIPLSVKKKVKQIDCHSKKLISDPPLYEEASTVVLEHQEETEKIKTRMINCGTELYQKLKQKMRDDARYMKRQTFQQKYLIHSDKEREQNLLKYDDPQQQSLIPSFKISEESFDTRVEVTTEKKPKTKLAINKPHTKKNK